MTTIDTPSDTLSDAPSGRAAVAVVIPCYRIGEPVMQVLSAIGPEVSRIYVVDDACPLDTGDIVERQNSDARVQVLRHDRNQGVGGAVITGYRAALNDNCDLVVKLDGDGQMDPALITRLIRPILGGAADYTKGNRFFALESLKSMPTVRLTGNLMLSFMTKVSTGYWRLFDPTNGFTAIHAKVLRLLPLDKVARDYFFESDMLFRLGTIRAKVQDMPMDSVYGDEESNLKIAKVIPKFLKGHIKNTFKRIFYNYFLRDFDITSVGILLGFPLLMFGVLFGVYKWAAGTAQGVLNSPGTVMLASLPILIGSHLLIVAIGQDIQNQPAKALHPDL